MIPNIIHFIFGLERNFGNKPFGLSHYLAVKSAYIVNNQAKIQFFYRYEPIGEWWEKTKPCVECCNRYLCPSPSNYETALNKPNLCNIK